MGISRVSEVLDETDYSSLTDEQKEALMIGNVDVSLNGLILESRKQVMSSASAMNFGGNTWRKPSMRMEHALEELPLE